MKMEYSILFTGSEQKSQWAIKLDEMSEMKYKMQCKA